MVTLTPADKHLVGALALGIKSPNRSLMLVQHLRERGRELFLDGFEELFGDWGRWRRGLVGFLDGRRGRGRRCTG
jgi:hypothetical protein